MEERPTRDNNTNKTQKSSSIIPAVVLFFIAIIIAFYAMRNYSELAYRAIYGAQSYLGFDVGFYLILALLSSFLTLECSIIAFCISVSKINENDFALALSIIDGVLVIAFILCTCLFLYCSYTSDWTMWPINYY